MVHAGAARQRNIAEAVVTQRISKQPAPPLPDGDPTPDAKVHRSPGPRKLVASQVDDVMASRRGRRCPPASATEVRPESRFRRWCLELGPHRQRTCPHGRARLCYMDGSAAPALAALLAKHQIGLTVEEVLDELDSAFAAIPGATTLSATEVDFLRAHAEPQAAAVIDAWSADDERQARARIALRQLTSALSGSVSIKEAAAILGVDRSRVSRRITGKALWVFDLQGSRRIPRWQFLGEELLPGLDVIVQLRGDWVFATTWRQAQWPT
ncbi:MAG: hypothetical protein JWR48_4798 [Mycobacterium sp.]|nr:hypothetical protein [Mycobacterium sp.]